MATFYPLTALPVQIINPDNRELATGFVLEAYIAGTSTPTEMFVDRDGTSAGTSITINASGWPEVSGNIVNIWVQVGVDYKFILKDEESNTEYTVDSIGAITLNEFVDKYESMADLISRTPQSDSVYVSSYYSGWADTVLGPQGGHFRHKTGSSNTSPSVGSAASVSSIGTGNQAGLCWDASGAEWRISVDEYVTVMQFGARGVSGDDTAACQDALVFLPAGKTLVFPSGFYGISATLSLDGLNFSDIRFEGGARILALADNITIFKSETSAFGVKVFDCDIRGNTRTGVVAFDVIRLEQLSAGIYRGVFRNLDTGIFLRELCTGVKIDTCDFNDVDKPIISLDPAGGVQINHPRIDNFGDYGIHVRPAILYGNVGLQIVGGYIQNGGSGVYDEGLNTQIIGTYFETCTVADINFNNSAYGYTAACNHTSTGKVAYKARNSDSIRMIHPFMASGGRTDGLFDFDDTNTNCHADYELGNSSRNTPVGDTTGLGGIPTSNSGTFTPVIEGSSVAGTYTAAVESGKWERIGKTLKIRLKITWSGHTGSGNILISGIPSEVGMVVSGERFPCLYTGSAYTGIQALGFTGSGTQMTAYNYAETGVLGLQALVADGSIELNATFTLA